MCSRPDVTLTAVYQELGTDYDERVLPSIVNEVLVVAQYNASQLITMRESVSRKIRALLLARASKFNLIWTTSPSPLLRQGVHRRRRGEAVAQQEAERARFVVDKAMQEKKSMIIKAQGEAKSASLIGAAIRDNPGFIQLRKLEAARDIASTLSKSSNRLFLDGGSLLLDVKDDSNYNLESRSKTATGETTEAPAAA